MFHVVSKKMDKGFSTVDAYAYIRIQPNLKTLQQNTEFL